jgi:hypothetical protein
MTESAPEINGGEKKKCDEAWCLHLFVLTYDVAISQMSKPLDVKCHLFNELCLEITNTCFRGVLMMFLFYLQ